MRLSLIMSEAKRHAADVENAKQAKQKEIRHDEDQKYKETREAFLKKLLENAKRWLSAFEISQIRQHINDVIKRYTALERIRVGLAEENRRRWQAVCQKSRVLTDDELRHEISSFDQWKARTYDIHYDQQLLSTLGEDDLTAIRNSASAQSSAIPTVTNKAAEVESTHANQPAGQAIKIAVRKQRPSAKRTGRNL